MLFNSIFVQFDKLMSVKSLFNEFRSWCKQIKTNTRISYVLFFSLCFIIMFTLMCATYVRMIVEVTFLSILCLKKIKE